MQSLKTKSCHSKYGARKTTVNGITFDSMKEACRYAELKLMERAGQITDLRLQVPFVLIEKQPGVPRAIRYIADFAYIEDGSPVVEDVKGFRTDAYKLKRAMMADKYGIIIRET